jgi:zinc D-Ala-D-Ala carboxypeptidase
MDDNFMTKIEALRHDLNVPFTVTSAYRCPDHPIEAAKKSPGAHASGRAIDIACQGDKAYVILEGALRMGLTGIGVNQKGGSRFIHLDDLEDEQGRPRPWVWSY